MAWALESADQSDEPEWESGFRSPEAPGPPRALLLGVETPDGPWDAETSLQELAVLCQAAGLEPVDRMWQRLVHPHPHTYVGKGKLEEVRERLALDAVDVLVADDELPPRVQAHLEDALKLRVIDRTAVILDIFAQRARTHEGRIQVELAQTQFWLPRLRAWGGVWSRTGGGIGTRGPGETQIEVERRRLRRRITALEREIEQVRHHRERVRRRRRLGGLPLVALVGYTNVGKTTLLNALTGSAAPLVASAPLPAPRRRGRGAAPARVADAPFVTLDPLTRVMDLEAGQQVLVSDTVGFISKLPATVVAAFRATLEELQEADLLVHVLDLSDPHVETSARIVEGTLRELGLDQKPALLVLNKADRAPLGLVLDLTEQFRARAGPDLPPIVTSARTGEGVAALKAAVARWLAARSPQVRVRIPYARADLVDLFYRRGPPQRTEYVEEGAEIEGTLPAHLLARFRPYLVNAPRAAAQAGGQPPAPPRRARPAS